MTEVVGTCSGITEKPSGWMEIEVTVPGKNYPVRLATKDDEIILATRALAGDVGTFTFTEKDADKINPHTNKPYVNRYLDSVKPYGNGSQPEPSFRPVVGGDKDRAITRMACLKAAAETVGADPQAFNDRGLSVMQLAARYETWVYRDIDDAPFS